MKRARIITAVVAGVLLLGGLLVYLAPSSEPTRQGRKLSEWIRDANEPAPIRAAALRAVREIGTNAFPIYWKWIQGRDNPLEHKINQLLSMQRLIRFRFKEDAEDKLVLAYTGIFILDTAAVPCLVEIIHNHSTTIGERRTALDCLSEIDRGRGIAVPDFVQLLKCPERELRVGAAAYLWKNYPDEAEKAGVYVMFPQWKPAAVKTNAQRLIQ